MATISTLAVNLIARTSVFERGMKRSRKSMGAFKKSAASTAINVAAITAAVTTAGFAIRSFTNAASRAQETMNLFNTVFAENSAETARWANDFAKNVGRSKTEVKEWAATLQDTFVPLGFARDKAAELSKTLVQVAVDVGSFKNIASDAEVINAFTSAIVGNGRAVRAYGVVLTNSTIEMESFASGLNKTFTELTELEKVQLRFNIIMKSTKDAQGDALKTADNYANRVKKLKGQIEDLKESFGKALLPAMTKMVTFMNDKMVPMFNKMSRVFQVTIKFLQSNTVKYLAMSSAIVFTAFKIKALIGVIKAISNSYRLFAIAQSIVLSLQGPKGWIVLAVAVGVATSAVLSLNKAMADTATQMDSISTSAKKSIESAATTIDTLRDEVARKAAFLERVSTKKKGVSGSGSAKAIEFAQKSLRLSEMQLVHAIQQKRIVQDIATEERVRLSEQERTIALSKEAENIRASVLTQAEALAREEALINELLNERLITMDEYARALENIKKKSETSKQFERDVEAARRLRESILTPSERQAKEIERINDLLAKGLITAEERQKAIAGVDGGLGELPSGRFQEVRSEFVDVAALNAGGSTKGIAKNNELSQKANFILGQLLTEVKGKDLL